MIVDAHAHLGYDEVFDVDFTAAELVQAQHTCGIDVTLVQPATAHDLDTVRRYHDAIAGLQHRHPGRFRGIANPNPHLPGTAYEDEIARCIDTLGFVGIKLNPLAHAVNPVGRHGRRVFAAAGRHGVPVMVHTGSGIPWSTPALLLPLAREHARLTIVAAHAGAMLFAAEMTQLAADCPNVCLEPSWVGGFMIREWVHRFGPERVMFGSDHADNAPTELAKFRSLGLDGDACGWVLGATAARVFGLSRP